MDEVVIPLHGQPLSLAATLRNGQAFRWWQSASLPGAWEGVAGHRWWRLTIRDQHLIAAYVGTGHDVPAAFLTHYFALDTDWIEVGAIVARAHPAARVAVARYPGLRVLRQDPVETLLSFSIATASHVPRITRSIDHISRRFGRVVAEVGGVHVRDFPSVPAIVGAPRDVLAQDCNLSFRAAAMQSVARTLEEHGDAWLPSLRLMPYTAAHMELDRLPHIGPKVADCVALMALDHWEAVPVDTHILAISRELFSESVATRSLTQKTYHTIGNRWRDVFGPLAGLAQQWLFHARRDDQGRVP